MEVMCPESMAPVVRLVFTISYESDTGCLFSTAYLVASISSLSRTVKILCFWSLHLLMAAGLSTLWSNLLKSRPEVFSSIFAVSMEMRSERPIISWNLRNPIWARYSLTSRARKV